VLRKLVCWGSTYYVQDLKNKNQTANIALNLNFDMLGSPNGYVGVYNGTMASDPIRNASEQITLAFTSYFDSKNQPYDLSEFNGRSDYGPFIENSIPAGGLDSGAEGIKTVAQRTKYGGLANTAYDPCYHQSCDTTDNIGPTLYEGLAKGAAHVLQFLSTTDLDTYLGSR